MNKQINLNDNLIKLHDIANWFEEQTQVDVEEGLKKVKEAAVLIKESKARLKEIENEFTEIQAEIFQESNDDSILTESEEIQTPFSKEPKDNGRTDSDITPDDIPF